MNQDVPLFSPFGFIQERMEYLEEGIVGDCSDCDPDMGHVAHITACKSGYFTGKELYKTLIKC